MSEAASRSFGRVEEGGSPGKQIESLSNVGKKLVPPGAIKSGRQRKKTATRAKGGEFRATREKKRVYFCSISSEMEMEGLMEELKTSRPSEWQVTMYNSVLHVYIPGTREGAMLTRQGSSSADERDDFTNQHASTVEKQGGERNRSVRFEGEEVPSQNLWDSGSKEVFVFDFGTIVFWGFTPTEEESFLDFARAFLLGDEMEDEEFAASEDDMAYICSGMSSVLRAGRMSSRIRDNPIASYDMSTWESTGTGNIGTGMAWERRGDEGAGSGADEEHAGARAKDEQLFDGEGSDRESKWKNADQGGSSIKGAPVSTPAREGSSAVPSSFGQDERGHIYLENDVYTISKFASPRERLALSFAMAQSSILAVFEARIQKRVEEYRYIPETYAANGKVRISGRRLGNMIGEVFVVRHDVNLHTEILDTPDWFWNNRDVEDLYKMVDAYLELNTRTAILNKRLDLLREMLTMLQLQHENHHTVKLEWIVIILILASVFVEVVTVVGKYLKYWN